MTRRERFRAYMASVDPATNPLNAIERGFYVNPPSALANQIVGRFEIDTNSRQLIVGGIGSGKTTQLLVCADALNKIDDIAAKYVDVSNFQDLEKVRPGCLVALASHELLSRTENVEKGLSARVSGWVSGYYDPYADMGYDDRGIQPGIITAPEPEWSSIDQVHVDDLKVLAEIGISNGKHAVFLFDSMDRMADLVAFYQVEREDIAALHACGIGVVVVGPIRSLEGFGRLDADRFDHLHFQSPIDVRADGEGRNFLDNVLRCRAPEDILSADARAELVRWSGGVIRDLMSLAKLAGEEAYLDGADVIETQHVSRAVDRFGRSMLMGLHQNEFDKLKRLQETGLFVQGPPSDMALLATRRVLKYGEQSTAYSVHPCIAPLLGDVGASDDIPF